MSPSTPFAGKPVASYASSPSMIGGTRYRRHLRRALVFLDAFILDKPEVMIGGVTAKIDAASGVATDATAREFQGKRLDAFATLVSRF